MQCGGILIYSECLHAEQQACPGATTESEIPDSAGLHFCIQVKLRANSHNLVSFVFRILYFIIWQPLKESNFLIGFRRPGSASRRAAKLTLLRVIP